MYVCVTLEEASFYLSDFLVQLFFLHIFEPSSLALYKIEVVTLDFCFRSCQYR